MVNIIEFKSHLSFWCIELELIQIVSEPWCIVYDGIVVNRVTLLKCKVETEDRLLSWYILEYSDTNTLHHVQLYSRFQVICTTNSADPHVVCCVHAPQVWDEIHKSYHAKSRQLQLKLKSIAESIKSLFYYLARICLSLVMLLAFVTSITYSSVCIMIRTSCSWLEPVAL